MRGLIVVSAVCLVLSVITGSGKTVAAADDVGHLAMLVEQAAQRLQTADQVAASKYLTGAGVDDPVRGQQVIDSVTKAAVAAHIDPGYVRGVFRSQIDATDSLEHSRFAQWKIDPDSAPTEAPDLSSIRDVINHTNHEMVDSIAAQWNALHSRFCGIELRRASEAAIVDLQLGPQYQPALDYAIHGYCV